MKKGTKITIIVLISLVILIVLTYLVFGDTIRNNQANQFMSAKNFKNAQSIYEDLLVDQPSSPYLQHNRGLSLSRQNQFEPAIENFQNAIKQVDKLGLNQSLKNQILNRLQYNLGNALFKTAETSQTGQTVNLYQQALESFQKAISANPRDLAAKYNYELTKLRLQEAQNQKNSPNQDQSKNNQDQQKQNQTNQNKGKQQQQNQNNTKQQSSSKQSANQNQMNKEEAAALLKMAENGEQYQGPIVVTPESPPSQDW